MRARLLGSGVQATTLRDFQIGYAPDRMFGLLEELEGTGYSSEELLVSGVASASERGHMHTRLRSRIAFPVRAADGVLLGFAGLATNPGPSWPEWLTSVEGERFRRSNALFGIERARKAIAAAGRAVVVRDCRDVLRLHQEGRREAVATVRSEFSAEHVAILALALGLPAEEVEVGCDDVDEMHGFAVQPRTAGASGPGAEPIVEAARRLHVGRMTPGRIKADPIRYRSPLSTFLLQVARVLTGIAVPLAWLAVFHPERGTPKGGTAFVGAVACVPATYVLLTLLSSWVSGRVRLRSRARRMRSPWEYGSTEWQPPAWTYHLVEDILIGAAPVSFLVCIGLFAVIFGFAS